MVQSYKKKTKVKEAKVDKEKVKLKDALKKHKSILIIIVIVIILMSGSGIGIWFKEYNEPVNRLKRYLVNNKYDCGNSTCRKEKDNITYTISFKNDSYQVSNDVYTLNISRKTPYIVLKGSTKTCAYEKEDYEPLELIDDEFTYNKDCARYIDDINESIKKYHSILNNAKVDIDDLVSKK